jgi:hypothetical protein
MPTTKLLDRNYRGQAGRPNNIATEAGVIHQTVPGIGIS